MQRIKQLVKFLFNDSPEHEVFEADDIEALFNGADALDRLEIKQGPLKAALASLEVQPVDFCVSPNGISAKFEDSWAYAEATKKLQGAEGLEALASNGWVACFMGDKAMTAEPSEYFIKFINIGETEPSEENPDGKMTNAEMEKLEKEAREFATEPMDTEDNFTKPKGKGFDKIAQGTVPKNAVHDSLKATAQTLVSRLCEYEGPKEYITTVKFASGKLKKYRGTASSPEMAKKAAMRMASNPMDKAIEVVAIRCPEDEEADPNSPSFNHSKYGTTPPDKYLNYK